MMFSWHCRVKIKQPWLYTPWSTKTEIEIGLQRGANSSFSNCCIHCWILSVVALVISIVELLHLLFFTECHQILHTAWKCGLLNTYCFWDKLKSMADFRGVQILILIGSATVAQLTVMTNTHTHRPYCICSKMAHLCTSCMRCSLIISPWKMTQLLKTEPRINREIRYVLCKVHMCGNSQS